MLFGLAQSLRSLTASPFASAVHEAHRMARQRLEAGGPAVSPPPPSRAGSPADSHDFLLPLDIDADEVAKAIQAKLGDRDDGSTRAPPLLARKAGGRVGHPMRSRIAAGKVPRRSGRTARADRREPAGRHARLLHSSASPITPLSGGQ